MSLTRRLLGCLVIALLSAACGAPHLPEPAQPLVPTPDAPFRKQRPQLSAPSTEPNDGLAVVESATLSNGLALWVVNRPHLPYVALSFVARDAGTLSGVAPIERVRLTTRSVVEGGTVWHDQRVVEPPMINGEYVSTWSGPTHSRFDLRVLSTSLDEGVTILGRTVQAPAFGRGNLDDVRLAELKRMQNASVALSNALFEMTLGAALGEEVAARVLGTNMDEVRRSGPTWIERCYFELFRPETSALIAVGDVKLAELVPLAERELGAWQVKLPRPAEPLPKLPQHSSNRVRLHFLPQLGTGQAYVLLLQPAPASRAVQDELAFLLMADIAVGAVSSRSNLSLRHDAGITYGVEPSILSAPELGLLRIEAAFETGETVRAVEDLQRMLQGLQEKPVTEAELSLAKVALLAQLERQSHSNQLFARYLSAAFAEGKSTDWFGSLPAAIAAVTAADVQRVARSYLRPRQLEIGIAGPPALALELESLGEVELYRASRGTSKPPGD